MDIAKADIRPDVKLALPKEHPYAIWAAVKEWLGNLGSDTAVKAVSNAGKVDTIEKISTKVHGASSSIAKTWNPLTEPGPLGAEVAKTFRGESYIQLATKEPTILYRVYGGEAGQLGSYWTLGYASRPCAIKNRSGTIERVGKYSLECHSYSSAKRHDNF